MADTVACMLLVIYLIALGLGPGCNFKGPGITYQVDGVEHHLLLGGKK